MSTQNPINKSSIFFNIITTLLVAVFISGVLFLIEFAPAKSWNVKAVAECALSLENKENASLIIDQVGETPRTGKIDRLKAKCRTLREDEKLIHANELVAFAKSSLKTN